jgi:hypothetical protein
MEEASGYPPRGSSDGSAGSGTAARIGEERAARILERAAALDAKRNSEIELDQLREAAEAAGISREAFDEAMEEQDDLSEPSPRALPPNLPWRGPALPSVTPGAYAHYTALLRDVLGDDGEVRMVEDRIEWENDEGVIVSIAPSGVRMTAAVSAAGRLRARLLTVSLSILPVFSFFFLIGVEEEEALLAAMGALCAWVAAVGGTWFQYRRERKALKKKVERIRRQLQHLLGPGGPQRI